MSLYTLQDIKREHKKLSGLEQFVTPFSIYVTQMYVAIRDKEGKIIGYTDSLSAPGYKGVF